MKRLNKDFNINKTFFFLCILLTSCLQKPDHDDVGDLSGTPIYISGQLGFVDGSGMLATTQIPEQKLDDEQTDRIKEIINEIKKSKFIGTKEDDFKISSSDYIKIKCDNYTIFSCGDVVYLQKRDLLYIYEFPKLLQTIKIWIRDGCVKGTTLTLPPSVE